MRRAIFSLKLIFFLQFVFASALSAQRPYTQQSLDSALLALPKMKADTAKINALNQISYSFIGHNSTEGIRYGKLALALATHLSWKKGAGVSLNYLGIHYLVINNYSVALEYFFKGLKINEQIGQKRITGYILSNIGNIYTSMKDYPTSLEYFKKASKIDAELGDVVFLSSSINNIGNIYEFQGNLPKALEYYLKALETYPKKGDENPVIQSAILEGIGNVYSKMGKYDDALKYLLKSLKISEKENDLMSLAYTKADIGAMYLQMGQDSINASNIKTGWLANSIQYLKAAAKIALELSDLDVYHRASKLLSEAYTLSGDYEKALKAYKEYSVYKDSIFNEEKTIEFTRKEMDYAYSKSQDSLRLEQGKKDMQAQTELSRQKNLRNGFLGGSVFLLIGIIGAGYAYRQKQRDNKTISIEKKRSEDLLLNILPPEIAEELKDHGASRAKLYNNVSILFTDFVNFSGISGSLNPQELVKELHECFTAFDAIIEKNGLEKIKTIGDAYMAVCGLPAVNERHAQNTAKAAIEIRNYIEIRKAGDGIFNIRIGINSGEVVAGIVGVKKFAYDIWGDAVNTAARMEQNSEPGKINISGSTYELINKDNPFRLQNTTFKGGTTCFVVCPS